MLSISSNRHKRAFTLFEILIVISLIAISFGFTAIQVPKALKKERFETAVEEVIAKISLATELMLDYRMDVVLIFSQKEGELFYDFKLNQPIPPKLNAKLKRNPKIKGIEKIAFDGKPCQTIGLLFDGTLGAISRGGLHLEGNGQEAHLLLRGFPSKIIRGNNDLSKEASPFYPEEILSAL